MSGKLFNLFGVLSIATLLASGGFGAYLFATDRLNAERLEAIAAIVRGDTLPGEGATEEDEANKGEDAQASKKPPTQQAADEAEARRRRERLEGLEIERAAEDLHAQERVLDQLMAHVVQEQEKLAETRREFEERQRKVKSSRQDLGFAKELSLVSGMKPAQAKEHLITTWKRHPADAIRLMKELNPRQAKRILDQMRTPDELQIMSDLLEQIRIDGTEGFKQKASPTRQGG